MIFRPMKQSDITKVRELHEKYYPQFNFPDFDYFYNAFIIEDDKGIIMAGGLEPVAEAVLITNKERSRITIGRGLVEAQRIALFVCNKFGIKELIAFVDDEDYKKHLIQHGFSESPNKMLYMRRP